MQQKLRGNIKKYYAFEFLRNVFFISAVLVPFFTDWGGISQGLTQTIQSFFMISIFLLEVPTGIVADRFGRKISLIWGGVFFIIGIIIYTITPDIRLFFIGEFILALGSALVSGANKSLVYDSLVELNEEHRAKSVLAKAESFKMAAFLLSGLLGGLLAYFFSIEEVVRLTLIPLGLSLYFAFSFVEPHIHKIKEQIRWKDIFTKGYKSILSVKKVRLKLFDAIIPAALAYFVIWFYQPKLQSLGISIEYLGIFHAVLAIAQIIVLQTTGFWEKIFAGEERFLRIQVVLMGLGFIVASIANSWILIIIFIFLSGGFGLARFAVYSSILNRNFQGETRATANSFINMFKSLFIAILNPIMGFLADWNLDRTLFILGILSLMTLFISSLGTRKKII
jgi:MFS family permease